MPELKDSTLEESLRHQNLSLETQINLKATTTPETAQILNLLRSYHGEYCPLNKILDLHISQYGRAIRDLRKQGYVIENKIFGVVDGKKHTGFRLLE